MQVRNGVVIRSASDLTIASKCEFAFLRALDAKLGRIAAVEDPEDAMLERSGRLGDAHESIVLERYVERFGSGVVQIERPDSRDETAVAHAVETTKQAFADGADVVFQATFADEDFIGFADFIVRQPDGRYLVQDTKLARRARVTALLQLAAYAQQLDRMGVPCSDTVQLLLGDGTISEHHILDIAPVYALRRARLDQIIEERLAEPWPVEWGDARYSVDGRCPTCDLEVQAHRDPLLVAGMRITQRTALREAGILTIDALAASTGTVDGIMDQTIENLRAQARLQLQAEAAETTDEADLGAPADSAGAEGLPPAPPVVVRDALALAAIPEPDEGDLFFDFEGDPLYTEGMGTDWNLDYLFGWVDSAERYGAIWAHSFAEERVALERFLAFVAERRQRHPRMHIYHYASYERSHLLSIAARHGVGEHAVDQLLADGVLVDLYPIVKRAVRVGSRSYSIKKLEPLYMGHELRAGDITSGGESIIQYVRARDLEATGEIDETSGLSGRDAAAAIFEEIADYNRYDCVSTLRLRDWLRGLAREHGVTPDPPPDEHERRVYEQSPLAAELSAMAGLPDDPNRSADQVALGLGAAAIDYHEREQKSFWWGHFFRLEQPIEAWENQRDVLIIDPNRSRVARDWFADPGQRVARRHLFLTGRVGPGSRFGEGSEVRVLYDPPAPFIRLGGPLPPSGSRVPNAVVVLETRADGVLVEERCVQDQTWATLPVAIVPGPPPRAGRQQGAINEWAERILATQPGWPDEAAVDILRRHPPRTRSGALAPLPDHDYVEPVVTSLLDLDSSYLAIQGPPGTGKTYVASRVIARLVHEHRYKIGVVAQSHSVVETVLDRVVEAGLSPELVGKAIKSGTQPSDHSYTLIPRDSHSNFIADRTSTGFVIGGTAWDFSNADRIPRQELDLLVIDEAGQFSLAATIATSVAARNLLLLGDPQQLPQVSQGIHPEPIDTSALGWITDGHDVLPDEYGYFLAESRRMHPAVAAPVSQLSYEGALQSHSCAGMRMLEGVDAGLHPVPVAHSGNATEAVEEAERVVTLAQDVLGRNWTDVRQDTSGASAEQPRPLNQQDLIIVTPYNAQLALIREHLDAAGLVDVPAGTVDKFQGKEAVIAIVSLAASGARDAPRGLEFLLLKNRLNVAISRAKWAAFLIYSPGLVDTLPRTPEGVAQLSAFVRLVGVTPSRTSIRSSNTRSRNAIAQT